jgi:hypothetical protein
MSSLGFHNPRSVGFGTAPMVSVVRYTFEDERPFQREFEGIQRFERISREHFSQLALFLSLYIGTIGGVP